MTLPPTGFVLVVEDSDEDFDTVLQAAREASLPQEIRRAATGGECLRLLADCERERRTAPLLVLLDLNTPGEDGRAVLRAIRGNGQLRTMPIVVLSTSDNPRDLDFCYRNGVNAYHTKPVSFPAHLRTLRCIFDYWLGSVVLPAAPQHIP